MSPMIVYTIPAETREKWELFRPFVERFFKTWAQFPPGQIVRTALVVNSANEHELHQEVVGETEQLFLDCADIQPIGWPYAGKGCDFGAQQAIADTGNFFQINFTTRMYFHRAGWLTKLCEARQKHGPGLYGLSASNEGGRLHLCTRGHCFDSADFREYPYRIMSRDQGVFVELGAGCLLDFFEEHLKRPAYLVGWDGVYTKDRWFSMPNRFRIGDQSNVLIWDKHTEAWANAGTDEKDRLTGLSEPHP